MTPPTGLTAPSTPIEGMLDALRDQLRLALTVAEGELDNNLLRDLLPVAAEVLATLQELEQLAFTWRLSLWRAGRANQPPITNPELARLTGVTEVNVMKQLKKDRDLRS